MFPGPLDLENGRRIGFFDSGIGGLTVLAEAMGRLGGADLLYFADTASVPYGDKPKAQVRQCVLDGVAFLVAQGLDALVVACNTATSVAIEDLRRQYAFPIIGMEPAVKPALQLTLGTGKRVLVLATDMTLREEKFHRLVHRIDEEARVDYLALQGLVTLAEAFDFAPAAVDPYLVQATASLDLEAYGAVVLGCTHFPFFRPNIARLFPEGTAIVDGNRGTVNNLCTQVEGRGLPLGQGSATFFESGRRAAPERFEAYLALLSSRPESA